VCFCLLCCCILCPICRRCLVTWYLKLDLLLTTTRLGRPISTLIPESKHIIKAVIKSQHTIASVLLLDCRLHSQGMPSQTGRRNYASMRDAYHATFARSIIRA
jgi:hypothetical protein